MYIIYIYNINIIYICTYTYIYIYIKYIHTYIFMIINDYGLQPAVPFCHQLSDLSGADVSASSFSSRHKRDHFSTPSQWAVKSWLWQHVMFSM